MAGLLKKQLMRARSPLTILAYLVIVPLLSVWFTVGALWVLDKTPLFTIDIGLFIDTFVLPLLAIEYVITVPKLLSDLFLGG